MKLKGYILIAGMLVLSISRSQEFNLGGVFGFNAFQFTQLDTAIYSPANTYHTYIESSTGAGLIKKNSYANGLHFGGAINFNYKRFTIYWEPQFYYQRSVFSFEKPIIVERVLAKKAFRMPLYFSYKFFKKEKSLYSIIGLTFSKEKNWDFQNPGIGYYVGDELLFDNNIDFGDDHFENVLYNDQGYWNLTLGLGRKIGNLNSSIRYQIPINPEKRNLSIKTWQIELGFSFYFLSTKEITQKHYLYVE
jgi:hypothetical protein